jgi:catechol 2,3-dioxygenase-like lactoylglutathione lyase family enzyme
MSELLHTCYRIGDIPRSVAFYEALGFEELRRMDLPDGATNVFMGLPGDGARLELTKNPGVEEYDLGTGYGHIAITAGGPRRGAGRPGRAGHQPRAAAVHGQRGRLAAVLRARPRRLPHRAHRARGLSRTGYLARPRSTWEHGGPRSRGAAMPSDPSRVLVVAHRTAANPALHEAVRERVARGPATFTLLVPNPTRGLTRLTDTEDASNCEGQAVLDHALPQLAEAAGAPVEGILGVAEPLAAVQDALNLVGFDEIIISTLPHPVSKWLRLDLPSKVAGLGLPVTTVTAKDPRRAAHGLSAPRRTP